MKELPEAQQANQKTSILKTKIVFFGTPQFAADVLLHLIEQGVSIQAVVTQPDRPKGRSLHLTPSPVKQVAGSIPVLQPEKASDPVFLNILQGLGADLFVVVAYGQILTQKLLDIPPLGCINIHASLLPQYRGAAPIQRCLLDGVHETGIAIQKMVRQLDAGDVIAVSKMNVPLEMNYGELEKALCELSKPLLIQVLKMYEQGIPEARPQDPARVTFAPKVEVEEAQIDWTLSGEAIHNRIRAFSPKPGAWCWTQGGKRLKIFRTRPVSGEGTPGQVLSAEGIIACGSGALKLLEVQPEGKKAMPAADWLRGQKNFEQLFTET